MKPLQRDTRIFVFIYRDWYLPRYNLRDDWIARKDFRLKWTFYEDHLREKGLEDKLEVNDKCLVRNAWFDKNAN